MANGEKDEATRRFALRTFSRRVLLLPNKCGAFVNILRKAVDLVDGLPSPASTLIFDIQAVLIGEGLRDGRGRGVYFVGTESSFMGAEGFQRNMRDRFFQVQHAAAGVVIGYRFNSLVEASVLWLEQEAQDDRLYEATFPIGSRLNDSNYPLLPQSVKAAICMVNATNIKIHDGTKVYA